MPFILEPGFTLIELMLVVAILGVLSTIALPKFANIVLKSKEAAVKGHLGSLRSAITLYYSNNEGRFPATAAALPAALTAGGKYLRQIPGVQVPPPGNHPYSTVVSGTIGDTGTWFYSTVGHAAVSCQNASHLNLDKRRWSAW